MAIDKSGIDAIQAFYLQHHSSVYERTFNDPISNNFMFVTNKDKLLLPSGDIGEVLQGYQPGHHPKGDHTLTGRMLEQKLVKVDTQIESRKFDVDYYYSFMNRSNNDPYQYPFEAWASDMVMKQIYEDFVISVLWNGVYAAPTPGTPNAAVDTADGFLKLINDEITATNLTPVVTGAIAAGTAVAQIRGFVKGALNTQAKRKRMHYCYTTLDVVDKYQENYEDLYGAKIHSDDPYRLQRVHGTNTVLVPQDGLSGDELILARPDNFAVSFDGAPSVKMFLWERYVRMEIDWKYGLQYASNTELYVNDQV